MSFNTNAAFWRACLSQIMKGSLERKTAEFVKSGHKKGRFWRRFGETANNLNKVVRFGSKRLRIQGLPYHLTGGYE
jgi:hypothetical protein